MPPTKSSFTIPLSPEQLSAAAALLRTGNYAPLAVPYTVAAASTADCRIMLYSSGKCLVQGRGAENWVRFVLEPEILHEARLGYEEQLDPAGYSPHIGVDESGKGDFFGPLVIAGVYVDAPTARDLVALGARDSKSITSDASARALAKHQMGQDVPPFPSSVSPFPAHPMTHRHEPALHPISFS